ncbi:MAG: hypothetical protein JO255_21700 [Alphaproteobacteria bacterium]|nr:hypothetical protein [Alphaproteobacteria bacterium]
MDHNAPNDEPRRLGPVEPDLLASALFVYSEYLHDLTPEPSEDDEEEGGVEIDTRAVLDLLSEELATDVGTTLNLFMRLTALQRLLATSPPLARMAVDEETGALRDETFVAAARLDLYVRRNGDEGSADFNVREFREALELF